MNHTSCFLRALGLAGVLATLTAGCASFEASLPKVEDVSRQRRERNQAAVREFEAKRDSARFEAARARWLQGDVDGCSEALQRLLARNPQHLDARLLMAELLLHENRPREAFALMESVVAAHPHDARVQHMMGLLHDAIGETGKALDLYERASQLDPEDEVYKVSYQTILSSTDQSQEPRESDWSTPTSLPSASSAPWSPSTTAGFDTDADPGFAIADDYASPSSSILPGEEPESICPDLRYPNSPDLLEPTGGPIRPGDHVDPADAMDSAEENGAFEVAVQASRSGLLERGLSAMSAGNAALAIAYWREAIAANPDDPHIPISAAVSALRHNEPGLAVTLLEPSLSAFADSVPLRRILATAYYRLGDYRSSQVALQQALSLDKSSALSYFLMGCTMVKLGETTAAEGYFRQARRLDPKYAVPR